MATEGIAMIGIVMAAALIIAVSPAAAQVTDGIVNDYPHVVIANGIVEAAVFLPDAGKGFYRSTRFDWSGMIWQLTCNGHTYFRMHGSRTPHDPENPGHGMSTAEEFGIGHEVIPSPQGFDKAKPGETFVKIGVGILVKPEGNAPYRFADHYEIADPGRWITTHGDTWVEFTQTLDDGHGYAYTYIKRMELVPGEPVLRVRHRLINTGSQRILMDQYCHNFFQFDDQPIGKQYTMTLAPGMSPSSILTPRAAFADGVINVTQDPIEGAIWTTVDGLGDTPASNRCTVTNTATGASVEVSGDFPLSRFVVFATKEVFSPEMFVMLDIAPGGMQEWTRTYRFATE